MISISLRRCASAVVLVLGVTSLAHVDVLRGPAAAADEGRTAPVVRDGSLDVAGWDDVLVGEDRPRLSWVIDDEDRGEVQTAYQVTVSAPGGRSWDSGKVVDAASTLRTYGGPALESGTAYTWRVRVWDSEDLVSEWSQSATFRTGLLDLDDWGSDWISVHSGDHARTEFDLETDVASAVLYYAAWGNLRVRLNGRPVSDEQLGTTWTDWDRRVLYRSSDVTELLRDGRNALGLTVGATLSAPTPEIKVLTQLEITDTDGERHTVVGTDRGWRTADSPLTRIDTYRGESYDARLDVEGWDEPGFDDSTWRPARVVAPVVGAPVLSSGATVTAKDAVTCCGWSPGAINDGILESTDSSQGYHSATTTTPDEVKWVQLDLGSSRPIGSMSLHGASPTNDPAGSNPGAGFPVRYRIEVSDDPTFATSTVVVDRTDVDQPNPGTTPVEIATDLTGRYLRVTATKLAPSSGSYSFRLAEVQVRGIEQDRDFTVSRLEPDPTPLNRVVDSIAPVAEKTVAPGVRRFDFGQNYAGWVQVSASAPAGTTATLYLGEIVDDAGRVTTSNINFQPGEEQRQTYRYTFAGTGVETWEPMFVYSGFRYVELSGLPEDVEVTLRARSVHTDLERHSSLELGAPGLTSIDEAVRRSQLNAMHGLPEDTPTREKKGWAGDALSGASSILSGFDSDNLYRKYLRDLQTSIFPDGGVASVAPSRQFGREFKVDPAWGAAYPGIAWEHYLQEGDRKVLAQHYGDFKGWLDYLAGIADSDHVVVNPEVSYGEDWQATVSTPPRLFHTVYYLKDTRITAQVARVLGHEDEAADLEALAGEIAAGINRRFLDEDRATYATGTQLANAFPLLVGIVPKHLEDRVLDNLVDDIRRHDNHLTTGFVGTQLVVQALHRYGRDDVVLDTALRDDYPSLGYMVRNGPGTIWEKWVDSSASDGTSSKDHPALGGGVEEWFFRGLAGITPLEPGFQRIRLAVPDLPDHPHAAASQETPLGTVSSSWTRHGTDLTYQITVPVGATAEVRVPAANRWAVREGGRPISEVDDVEFVRVEDGDVVLEVGSGDYRFVVDVVLGDLGSAGAQATAFADDVDALQVTGVPGTLAKRHLQVVTTSMRSEIQDAWRLHARQASAQQTASAAHRALARVADLDRWLRTYGELGVLDDATVAAMRQSLTGIDRTLSRASARLVDAVASLRLPAEEILPGDVVRVAVVLENAGRHTLTGVDSALEGPAGWTVKPAGTHRTTVPAGGKVEHAYDVTVPADADPGAVGLTGTVSYEYTGGRATMPLSADLLVAPGVAINSTTTTPDAVAGGETATVTATLRNRTGVAQSGELSATVPTGWAAVEAAAYDLAPGEEAEVPLQVAVPLNVAAGNVQVTVATGTTAAEQAAATVSVALPTPPTPPAAVTDHVDLGNGASESAHGLTASPNSGTNVEAGLTRRYTHSGFPGGWFELDVAVPADGRFLVRVIETFDGARRKTYDVELDDAVVHSVDLTRAQGGQGAITHQFVVEPSAATADGTVRLRFRDTGSDSDPSIADLWVLTPH